MRTAEAAGPVNGTVTPDGNGTESVRTDYLRQPLQHGHRGWMKI